MIAGEHRLALPAGYQLGKYRFKEILGAGGFGITYLAEDISLGRRVAIKELLPNDIATRLDGSTVVAKSKSEEDNLAWARDRFVKEGRALAACEHPNVVHVYEMIEANGTAYMVTKFEDGRSLSEWLKEVGGSPDEKDLRSILVPLLAGLDRVHKSGFLHRDLKPENIYITDDGRPLLLDFGSARQAISDRTTSLTSIVTSGYAPFEQYHEDGKQGAWTDLYALAAVMYRAIHGKKPPEATRRLKDDPCLKLAREYSGKYSPQFLHAIDKALAVEAQKRPQSVAEWRSQLGDGPVEKEIVAVPWWQQRLDEAAAFAREQPAMAAGIGGAVVLLGGVLIWKLAQPGNVTPVDPDPRPTPVPALVTPAPATPTPAPATPRPIIPQPPSTPVQAPATPVPKSQSVVEPVDNRGAAAGPLPGQSWANSIGQMYLPVTGTNIHLGAAKVTRGDFETFVRATGYDATDGALSLGPNGWTAKGASWVSPSFPQTASHPVVGVNFYDALEFCRWLTAKERAEGKIGPQLAYRLPTDEEWSKAAGRSLFTWGDAWPPPVGAGNFAGQERKSIAKSTQLLADYNDGFTGTSPVRTYQPNSAGFYDLSGNSLDLCATWFRYEINPPELRADSDRKEENTVVVLRGSSWMSYNRGNLRLELRDCNPPQARYVTVGFRCVLGPVAGAPHLDVPPPPQGQNATPLAALEGMDVVDRRLVAIWEYKPGNASEGALRWEQEGSGRYKLSRGGEVVEAGASIAREGRLQQQPDGSAGKSTSTYRLKTSTQLVTDGPLGEISWRRIRALSTEQKEPIAKEDTGDGGKRDNTSPQNNKPRGDDAPSRPKPRPQPNLERKARDIGNSIRRRLPF